jgi:hypothetical protein
MLFLQDASVNALLVKSSDFADISHEPVEEYFRYERAILKSRPEWPQLGGVIDGEIPGKSNV